MSEFLFIISAVGVTAILAGFFRYSVSTPSAFWTFVQTGAIVLAAFALLFLQGATPASFPEIHAPVLVGWHETASLTAHDLLSVLCCAVLGAAAHAHLSARIKNPQTEPDRRTRVQPILRIAPQGADAS